jgi:3-methylcrotonyl-CoA carboxylase alpha subunit
VFGDAHGDVVHLFERDCSLQRRHQKVIEESPAFDLPEETRQGMTSAAVAAAKAVGYAGAGTVEFIVDTSRGLGLDSFYFLEMNTRLQVEHPVTEAITGIDLVEWQFRVAAGEPLPLRQSEIRSRGAAIEARLCAEDPEAGFLPSPGLIRALRLGPEGDGLRVDAGVEAGDSVTPFYDSMIAKLIAHAPTRDEALAKLRDAIDRAVVIGPKTNLAFLSALLNAPEVIAGTHDTAFIDAHLAWLGAGPREPEPRAVLAAAEALWRARLPAAPAAGPVDPWAVADGFELTGSRRAGFEARIDGKAERLVAIGGPPPALFPVEDGVLALCEGRQIHVCLVDPLEGAAAGGVAASGEILAPMHGRVIALHVEEGQIVDLGAPLAVVEAMKMEHALTAPRAGRIEGLAVSVGRTVEQGDRLMGVAEV